MSGSPDSPLPRLALGVASIALTLAASWMVGQRAEASALTLMILLVEPAIWVALVAVALYGALAGRWTRALAALALLVGVSWNLRRPPVSEVPQTAPEALTPTVRECASQIAAPRGTVRVATWNTGGQTDPHALARAVAGLRADVIVLQEIRGERLLQQIVDDLQDQLQEETGPLASVDGDLTDDAVVEGVFSEAMRSNGLGLIVRRGVFGVCGQAERDFWPMDLPAASGRTARATLAFPKVAGVGYVPVVAAHLDRPARLPELATWPRRIHRSALTLGGLARALDNPALIVLGDTNTHGTFRRFSGVMQGAGLFEVPPRPTWPASLLGVPALPLYPLDRVWHGAAWAPVQLRAVRTASPSDHLAVVTELRAAGDDIIR
ncbi:MAG: endonuclease/exonuclease/phosphatase family protein [Alphaproteobacteria bacterium]|nr:endonuclease/exonuclease/phosphatase family protein [Alphaproteobacteria bacterium]